MGGAVSAVKNFGGRIFEGLKKGGSKVLDVANTIRSGVKKGYNFVSKIPIIGNMVNKIAETPIPLLKGMSIKDVGRVADSALDTANFVGDMAGLRDNKQPAPPSKQLNLVDVSRMIGQRGQIQMPRNKGFMPMPMPRTLPRRAMA